MNSDMPSLRLGTAAVPTLHKSKFSFTSYPASIIASHFSKRMFLTASDGRVEKNYG
jgi:hypothetical protein